MTDAIALGAVMGVVLVGIAFAVRLAGAGTSRVTTNKWVVKLVMLATPVAILMALFYFGTPR